AKEKLADKAKEEKRKGHKPNKKLLDADEVNGEDTEAKLVDDATLQESIRIAADYVQTIKGKALAKLSLPDVIKAKKDRQADEKKLSSKKKG
ncbi:MAG: hypothetical protein NTV34_03030, partial [Proteobacteria bacterium]|nr:hypothetical protein [Pseudomonadota bacterium]